MLLAALFWRPRRRWYRPALPLVLLLPAVSMYHRGWGRPGDTGFVAEEDHGEGYVDAETPELAIAVVDGRRGRGIGRGLFEAIHEQARADGIRRIALSVDADDPARRPYASLGYEDYEPGDGKGRMVLDLTAG